MPTSTTPFCIAQTTVVLMRLQRLSAAWRRAVVCISMRRTCPAVMPADARCSLICHHAAAAHFLPQRCCNSYLRHSLTGVMSSVIQFICS